MDPWTARGKIVVLTLTVNEALRLYLAAKANADECATSWRNVIPSQRKEAGTARDVVAGFVMCDLSEATRSGSNAVTIEAAAYMKPRIKPALDRAHISVPPERIRVKDNPHGF